MADPTERAAEGDAPDPSRALTPEAFAERFQSAWQTLWCIAAAVVHDRAAAEDVVQEAAVVALGKLSQFDARSNFTAWMGRIVRYVALNHARRRAHAVGAGASPETLEMVVVRTSAEPVPVLSGRGQLMNERDTFDDRLIAGLRSLDETARACLLLRTVLDMPYREISRALDIAEGTAMSHVHRARAALRERLLGEFPPTRSMPLR